MSIFSDIGNAVSSVVSTAENVVGAGLNAAEGAIGTVVKAGEGAVEGAVGDLIHNPLDIFNPFNVIKGAVSGGLGALEGGNGSGSIISQLKGPFTEMPFFPTNAFNPVGSTPTTGDGSSVADLGGGSIEAVLLELASKERNQLADKVNQLKNLQVPGQNASAQDQANYDSTKTELMADIQSIQNSIQQITTMATNVQKNDNDTNMSVIRNMGS